jgi:hypothetical protein
MAVGPPRCDRAQEILLFQRYNYSRFQIARVLARFKGKAMPMDVVRELLGWTHRAMMGRSQIVQVNIPLVLAKADAVYDLKDEKGDASDIHLLYVFEGSYEADAHQREINDTLWV